MKYCMAYLLCLHTLMIASGDGTLHKQHLQEVLQRLSHYGFRLNLDECVFSSTHIDFLGHHTDATGITPLPKKVNSINNFPVPVPIKQLHHFIGTVNFYQ